MLFFLLLWAVCALQGFWGHFFASDPVVTSIVCCSVSSEVFQEDPCWGLSPPACHHLLHPLFALLLSNLLLQENIYCISVNFQDFVSCGFWLSHREPECSPFIPFYCFSEDRLVWLSTHVVYVLCSVIEHSFLTVFQFCSVSQMVLTVLISLIYLYICSKTLVHW
jgi:hypothetical protein